MNKKQRCFIKRFAALVAALVISLALPVSAFAASDTEADMPSDSDFLAHRGSWFVWRTFEVRSASGNDAPYYELCSSPIFFDSSGNFDISRSLGIPFKSSYFDISVISRSDEHYEYACALPVPLAGLSGYWNDLPSFPVGYNSLTGLSCLVALYSSSSLFDSNYRVFLSPCSSLLPSSVSFSNSIDSSTDSVTAANFPSPLYSFPFAFRSYSSSIRSPFTVQGGDNSCINLTYSSSNVLFVSFKTNKFLVEPDSFSPYPSTYSCPSSDLGLVVIKQPSSSAWSASDYSPSTSFTLVPTLLVPAGMLPDVKLGDWISDSPEDLQDAITNEFGVDSGKLKDSKDSLNSWNSASSVDTDLADTSLSTIDALFQNLGQFLAIVSLMIFGAVVLRMLLKKAVDG